MPPRATVVGPSLASLAPLRRYSTLPPANVEYSSEAALAFSRATKPPPLLRRNAPRVVGKSAAAAPATTTSPLASIRTSVGTVSNMPPKYVDHSRLPPPAVGNWNCVTKALRRSFCCAAPLEGLRTPGVVGKLFDHVAPTTVTISGLVG